MSEYSDLRTAIVGVLDAIPNIGAVHNRERFSADMSKYLDNFKTSISGQAQIRGWCVLREGAYWIFDEVFGERRRRHQFVLYGVQGFSDAADTYGAHQAQVDAILAAFDGETTLGVSGVIVRMVGPAQLRAFRNEQFGSVLCHAAEIELPIDVMRPLGTP